MSIVNIFEGREGHIAQKGEQSLPLACNSDSLAGAVSQRACVYSGARVVLNPITDALHLVHGPIGCASYTWDIRGSTSIRPRSLSKQLLHGYEGAGCDLRRREEAGSLFAGAGGEISSAGHLRLLHLHRGNYWRRSDLGLQQSKRGAGHSRSACEVGGISGKQE